LFSSNDGTGVKRETDNRHDGLETGEAEMDVGDRLKLLRELKGLSQGEIEERSGLFRCYISKVENGHAVPVVETLEKFVRALDVPLYQLLYEGEKPPERSNTRARNK
jgi:transcriptional regulator with XRE-family HTH domain